MEFWNEGGGNDLQDLQEEGSAKYIILRLEPKTSGDVCMYPYSYYLLLGQPRKRQYCSLMAHEDS